MERTLRLYPLYQLAAQMYFWLPVYVLFFARHLPLGQILQLEAIYYFGCVGLEVPSGYLADRLGRRRALLVAAACGIAAHGVFFFGQSFAAFALAQVLLSGSIAFVSGSDSALLYDALAAEGTPERYAEAEGRAGSYGFAGIAIAAVASGVVASLFHIRLAFLLSMLAQIVAFAIVCAMIEPPVARSRHSFAAQLGDCVRRARTSPLRWALGFFALATVINHVPYELYQPYLSVLLVDFDLDAAPLAAGALLATSTTIAGRASLRASTLSERFGGPVPVMCAALILQLSITWLLGLWLHWLLLLALMLRSVPSAVQKPLMGALINPHLPSEIRATYLSLMSLVGRLAFAGTLLIAAASVGSRAVSWHAISSLALGYAAVCGLLGLVLLITAPADA